MRTPAEVTGTFLLENADILVNQEFLFQSQTVIETLARYGDRQCLYKHYYATYESGGIDSL